MSARAPFVASRDDGRSDAQVVIDLVCLGVPGTIYTYDEIGEALRVGTDRNFGVREICRAAQASFARLLKEHQRTLYNVRGRGYRLAAANEHNKLALVRTRRADVQQKRGLQVLSHVRWDELDENTRRIHEGMLMILSSFHEQQKAMDRRLHRVEEAIRDLTSAAKAV